MTGSELALPDAAEIESLAPAMREHAVTQYLTGARDRLALALEATGPEAVASMRAELATVADMSKRLALSKEIQTDALEMVRRAEFALGKAIRKGQEEGTIATISEIRTDAVMSRRDHQIHNMNLIAKPRPSDFAPVHDFTNNRAGIYHLADGVEPEQFEAALAEAKAEGNVSRANVVRKVKGESGRTHCAPASTWTPGRSERSERLLDGSAHGVSSLRAALRTLMARSMCWASLSCSSAP